MEYQPKICMICGSEYMPHNSNQRYCGPACRKEGDLARQRRYNAEAKMRMMTVDEKIDRKIEVGIARRMRRINAGLSLTEVARRANETHMTYGKYVTKYNI